MAVSAKYEKVILLPEDTYNATLEQIEEAASDDGSYWRWSFETTNPETSEAVSVIGNSSAKLTENTKAGGWLEALTGFTFDQLMTKANGKPFESYEVEGKPCRLVIEHTEKDGNTYARIKEVLAPVKQATLAENVDAPF